jgi:histidinol dehydrogenase
MKYYTKPIVCDTAVYKKPDSEDKPEELIVICNSAANAMLIAEIMNADAEHDIHPQTILIMQGLKAENERLKREIKDYQDQVREIQARYNSIPYCITHENTCRFYLRAKEMEEAIKEIQKLADTNPAGHWYLEAMVNAINKEASRALRSSGNAQEKKEG